MTDPAAEGSVSLAAARLALSATTDPCGRRPSSSPTLRRASCATAGRWAAPVSALEASTTSPSPSTAVRAGQPRPTRVAATCREPVRVRSEAIHGYELGTYCGVAGDVPHIRADSHHSPARRGNVRHEGRPSARRATLGRTQTPPRAREAGSADTSRAREAGAQQAWMREARVEPHRVASAPPRSLLSIRCQRPSSTPRRHATAILVVNPLSIGRNTPPRSAGACR